MRDLLVAYRLVTEENLEPYDRAWIALRNEARSLDLRAWRFRSTEVDGEFVEFLEGAFRPPPHTMARLERTRRALDEVAPAVSKRHWEEAPLPEGDVPAAAVIHPAPPSDPDRPELLSILRARSLKRGEFVLASGQRSNYYVDARPTTMSAAGQRLIGRLGLAELRRQGWAPAAIGGLTLGADPVAYAIAHASALTGRPIDAFTVRKQAKEHGTGRRIEGNLGPGGADVVIIEDVMTSGGSALEAAAVVSAAGGRVLGVLTVVDREAGGGERLAAAGYRLTSLFAVRELLGD